MRRPSRAVLAAFAVVIAVATGSCSARAGPKAPAVEPAETPISLADPPTFSAVGGEGFCARFQAFQEAGARLLAVPSTTNVQRELYQAALSAVRDLVEVAPKEIEQNVNVVRAAYLRLVPSLEAVDFDLTRLPQDAVAILQTAEFRDASVRLTAFVQQVCKTGE